MGEYLQKAYLDRLEKERREKEHKKGLEYYTTSKLLEKIKKQLLRKENQNEQK